MQVHAAVLGARSPTEERHAVLSRTIARSHDLGATAGRGCSIYCSNSPSSVLPAMICDVQADDRSPATRGSTLDNDDLGDLAILPKVLARA